MRFGLTWLSILAAALFGGGCGNSAPAPSQGVSATNSAFSPLPTAAQPRLPTTKLWLGAREIVAELALSAQQQETGMMYRTNIAEEEGMLFVFMAPRRASFWMKNVPIPLSCAYIDPAGEILEIHDMKAQDPTPIVARSDRIQYVLEVKEGWFGRNKVGVGSLVRTDQGSLAETFFRRR